jgi:riboflavin biosynthesis pyrimidine reductase
MLEGNVNHLYPPPQRDLPLEGLYLRHAVRNIAAQADKPFVYANFITSLDGRIAVPDPEGRGVTLAEAITNPRDWRLFQELAVQADILITSGRYLREHAHGAKQEVLDIYQEPQFQDLKKWRLSKGLKPHPDVAVISRSLGFEVPESFQRDERTLFVFTTESANQEKVENLMEQGARVLSSGSNDVDGSLVLQNLESHGFRVVYSTAGPRVAHLLLRSRILDRLYLTFAHRLLGGSPFTTIVEGQPLTPPVDFRLSSLVHDPHALDGSGQLYASFTRIRPEMDGRAAPR